MIEKTKSELESLKKKYEAKIKDIDELKNILERFYKYKFTEYIKFDLIAQENYYFLIEMIVLLDKYNEKNGDNYKLMGELSFHRNTIDKRLETDFTRPTFSHNPNLLQIELPSKRVLHKKSKSLMSPESIMSPESQSIEYYKPANYLSSPLSNEELIVPININEKSIGKYNFTPRRHHKQKKTHKTYKVYKKQRTSSKSKSKPKSKSKTKSNFTLF